MPGTHSGGEDGTISERAVIRIDTGRVSGVKETVVGSALAGGRIFLSMVGTEAPEMIGDISGSGTGKGQMKAGSGE